MTTSQSAITRTLPAPAMPLGRALELVGRTQQPRFREMRADQLQPHRQPIDEAAGHRHARQPGQIRADGIDVVQIHGHRIVDLGADVERRGGRGRPDQQIDLLKRRAKIIGDQPPHFLRLEIIGIEIAGRQHIGAGHDAPLDLGAETLAARALVQVDAGPSAPRSGSRSARRRSATDSRSIRPARPRSRSGRTAAGAAGSPPRCWRRARYRPQARPG